MRRILTHWSRDKMAATFPATFCKCIFFNENMWILIKISLKFVPNGQINSIPTLVQIMAWRRPSEPMMVSLLTHVYASIGLIKLNKAPPTSLRYIQHSHCEMFDIFHEIDISSEQLLYIHTLSIYASVKLILKKQTHEMKNFVLKSNGSGS